MEANFNPEKIKMIVGLGNPGGHYENTYHNVGHLFVDCLKRRRMPPASYSIKTDCFMNESGGFVKKKMKHKEVKLGELMIVHDDSDLGLGQYKIDFGRGSAGHGGVESIIKALGTKDFWRLRFGIRPAGIMDRFRKRKKAGDFVLKKISPRNMRILRDLFTETSYLL